MVLQVFCKYGMIYVTVNFMLSDKEGNVLFNYAINAFYLRLYGIRHMVKMLSDNVTISKCVKMCNLYMVIS